MLVPTCVGMILEDIFIDLAHVTCPHMRGDDPMRYCTGQLMRALSPHAWG